MRWLLRVLVVMGGLTTVVAVPGQEKAERPKTDAELLVGTWQIVAVEENGGQVPDFWAKAILFRAGQEGTLRCWLQPKEDSKRPPISDVSLDLKTTPKTMDLMSPTTQPGEGGTVGIFQLQGDELKMVQKTINYGDYKAIWLLGIYLPPSARPKAFKTEKGDRSVLFQLKRVSTRVAEAWPSYDPAHLLGTWQVVGVEKDGQSQDSPMKAWKAVVQPLQKRGSDMKWSWQGQNVPTEPIFVHGDGPGVFSFFYGNPSTRFRSARAEIVGDDLQVLLPSEKQPFPLQDLPKTFKTEKGDGSELWRLKRITPEK